MFHNYPKRSSNLIPKFLDQQALVTFLDAVKDGLSIAACISRVQDQVLHKVGWGVIIKYSEPPYNQVPNERCKFFVKFVYDNQLQVT